MADDAVTLVTWRPRYQGPALRVRLCFLLLTLAICVVQAVSGNEVVGGLSNWLIPDTQATHEVLEDLITYGIGAMSWLLPEQFVGFPINPLLYLYYYPFYLLTGVVGAFLANQFLIQAVGGKRLFFAILLTPYFLLSFVLPSKDMLVLALFVPYFGLLLQRRYLAALLIATAIFLVRDGGGVIALSCLLAVRFAPVSGRLRLLAIAAGMVGIAILNEFVYRFLGEAFILARNAAQAEGAAFGLGGAGAGNYLIRLFGNATNLAFRPTFLDMSGHIAVLPICYWVSGISALVCLWYAVAWLWKGKSGGDRTANDVSLLAMLFLTSLVIISLNPAVQPRYQLFFVVILLQHILRTEPPKEVAVVYLCSVLVSAAAAVAYVMSGIGLPGPNEWGQPTAFR